MPRLPFLHRKHGTGQRLGFLASSASVAPIAVDYGRRSIRLLQLARGERAYECLAGAELPGWVLATVEEPHRHSDLGARMRETISGCGFLGGACSLTLPSEVFRCDTARLPVMPDAELKQSVEFEATDRFGVDKATTVLGHMRLGEAQGGQQEVLILAVPRSAVEAAVAPARAAGLATTHLEHAAFAALRAVARQRKAEVADPVEASNFAMVHLEDRIATLIVMHDSVPTMVRSVLGDWAPNNTTIHKTSAGRAPKGAAAQLASTGDTAIAIAIDPAPEASAPAPEMQTQSSWRWCSLAEETLRCLRHLERNLNGWWPTRLVITGPSACDPQIVTSMESVCALQAELAIPIRMINSPAPCVHGNPWIAAIGAATNELPALSAGKTAHQAQQALNKQGAAA